MQNELKENEIVPANEQGNAIELANGVCLSKVNRTNIKEQTQILLDNARDISDEILVWNPNTNSKASKTDADVLLPLTLLHIPISVYKTHATEYLNPKKIIEGKFVYRWLSYECVVINAEKGKYDVRTRSITKGGIFDEKLIAALDKKISVFSQMCANLPAQSQEYLEANNYEPSHKLDICNNGNACFGYVKSVYSLVTKKGGAGTYDYIPSSCVNENLVEAMFELASQNK